MSTDWEQAAAQGNLLAAADLSAKAFAHAPDDADKALAALVCQSKVGRYEDVFDIFRENPDLARDPNGFAALIFSIAFGGALPLVEEFDLFPSMEQMIEWHPALAEFSVRIAGQCLARDPEHIRALKHLEVVLAVAAGRRDTGLAARAMMACPARLRAKVRQGFEQAWGGLPTGMFTTVARFAEQDLTAFLEFARTASPQQIFPAETVVRRMGTGTGVMTVREEIRPGTARPVLNAVKLARGAKRLRDEAAGILGTSSGFPARAFRRFADDGLSPILIVSTGRVGTRAIEMLFNMSDGLVPFHSLSFHVENGDHNGILYRMLAGDDATGNFGPEIDATLCHRLSEFAYCHATGKTPVLVNHLDSILIPLYLAAFPNARVVRMHRDSGKTLRSLAYKNQFGFRQLRHLIAGFDEDGRTFRYRRDRCLTLEQECIWYMHVTDLLAKVYETDIVALGRFLDLDMEQVFALDGDAIGALVSFIDDPGVTSEACRDVFSQRVNEKAHYTVDDDAADPGRLAENARHWTDILARDGGYGRT